MTAEEVFNLAWDALVRDLPAAAEFPRPLLAHYCSIGTLERILSGKELWLSNPLYMNDLEEVRFGVMNGFESANKNAQLRNALQTDERRRVFFEALDEAYDKFSNEHVFDCYVTCFSQHLPEDNDGKLSMWRAYGANGDGAALVFDINSISHPGTPVVGLILGKVQYGTGQQRSEWLDAKVEETARFMSDTSVETEQLPAVAAALAERIKLIALFSKHSGFREELEWRLVYMPQLDSAKVFRPLMGYSVGPRGVEPKLKLPLKGVLPGQEVEIVLSNIIDRLLLGPSVSDSLARRSVCRMLELLGLRELNSKVRGSTIPLRPSFHVPGR